MAYERELDLSDAVEYHYGAFPPNSLDYQRLIRPLSEASLALGRYREALGSMHNSRILLAPLRRQEAVITSRIEGTVATLDEVLKLEADISEQDSENPDFSSGRAEAIEVLCYARAMDFAQRQIETENMPICSRLICETHDRLLFLGRGSEQRPGQIKTKQNYIADRSRRKVLFVPISPDKVQDALSDLEKYINRDDVEALLQSAISHLEFEAIHPFNDGNGRLGRMLITLSLWVRGIISAPHFYVSQFFEEHKDEYIDRMRRVSRDGEWTEWCEFYLSALRTQADYNLQRMSEIRGLYDEMKIIFSDTLGSRYSIMALDYMFERPVFKNNHFTSKSDVPSQTAARFTRELHNAGLISVVEPAAGRRSAMYMFTPLFSLVHGY